MMMLLCFNPYLSREGAIEALGSYRDVPAERIGLEWDIVYQIRLLKSSNKALYQRCCNQVLHETSLNRKSLLHV